MYFKPQGLYIHGEINFNMFPSLGGNPTIKGKT
jgi:hypothetical protein